VCERFPEADLAIAGAGPEESALKSLCVELGLERSVCFAGHVRDLHAHFAAASVFVLSSRHEGMPNALLEAAAAGLPIAALPCSQGVTGLLCGQPGVWLARDISMEALGECLLEALTGIDPGQRFLHPFVEQFRLDRAITAYEALIDSVLDSAPGKARP